MCSDFEIDDAATLLRVGGLLRKGAVLLRVLTLVEYYIHLFVYLVFAQDILDGMRNS